MMCHILHFNITIGLLRKKSVFLDFFGFLYVFLGENQVQEEPMEVELIDQDPVKKAPLGDVKMVDPIQG